MRLISRAAMLARRRGRPTFTTDDVKIGQHVRFGQNVTFNSKRVRIGDGVIIHDNVTVDADVFEVGDYGTIYDMCRFPGPGELRIGHNFWLGTGAIVDSKGGTRIGNNVGVGAYSQLWTHMVYGDVMYGCRFHSARPLTIEDDVWLVGHCLVSPVSIGARSLAMLGSLITRDMDADRSYAGVPAQDITEKVGSQFDLRPVEDRKAWLEERLAAFQNRQSHPKEKAVITTDPDADMSPHPGTTLFNVATRTYTKRLTRWEFRLMRFLLPDAKFVPADASTP